MRLLTSGIAQAAVAALLAAGASAAAPWSCTAGGAPAAGSSITPTMLTVAWPTYSLSVGGVLWAGAGDLQLHQQGSWYSSNAGTLTLVASASTQGTDAWGTYDALYQNVTAPTGVAMTASYRCYATGAVVFDLAFPGGASGVNGSYPNTTSGGGHIVGAGDPVTFFPSFAGGAGDWWATQAGTLRHGGIWTLWEWWGRGAASLPSGVQSSPLYVFNTSFAPATDAPPGAPLKPTTGIFSPLTHFHLTIGGSVTDRAGTGFSARTGFGLASTVVDVPPGYATSVMFVAGTGITDTAWAWGALMQGWYGTQRLVGPGAMPRAALTERVSYWSDNGAVHFQSWWDRACPGRNCSQPGVVNPQDLFVALKQYHNSIAVPFGIYQVDTWWFYQSADVAPGGDLDCIDWRPRADMWPNGLPWVTRQAGGIPLLLYSWGYAPLDKGQRMLNYTWETSLAYGGDLEAQPILDEVYAFYSEIRDRFLTFNGTSFESDNMGTQTLSYASHVTAADGVERWWAGFASPFCEAAIPVQICESNPADVLESLKYGCVTTSRDNIDDVPGATDSTFVNRWHTGFDRMLIAALGLQPFADNVWSKSSQPGSTWDPATEDYVELAYILSVLSAGPVGIGDMLGNSNASLIMTCCAADGTLLKASTPSTYLDWVYLPPAVNPIANVGTGRVFQAMSYVAESAGERAERARRPGGGLDAPTAAPYAALLAVDVANAVDVLPGHLSPDVSVNAVAARRRSAGTHRRIGAADVVGYVGVPWNPGFDAVAAACADGAPASPACAFNFSAAAPWAAQTGVPASNLTHFWRYSTLSPLYACPGFTGGYALLGELGKVVRVSPVRFPSAAAGCAGGAGGTDPQLMFQVAGAPGEQVRVTVLAPTTPGAGGVAGRTWNLALTLPPGGASAVVCTGAGDASNPCSAV